MSALGMLTVARPLSQPVDLALSSATAINVNSSVSTSGSGTAAFVAPNVMINGSVNAASDVGIIANTISFGAGSSTHAGHDVVLAAANVTATNASVSAGHDILAAVAGDMHLNGSGLTAGTDVFVSMLGANSTLYLNDAAGLPQSFIWAQAPSTIHMSFPARASGGMVVDGLAVDPLTFAAAPGASGLFYGTAETPATLSSGLDLTYGVSATATAPPGVLDAVFAALGASSSNATGAGSPPAGTTPLGTIDVNALPPTGSIGLPGGDQTGGTPGTFGGPTGQTGDSTSSSTSTSTSTSQTQTDPVTGLTKLPDKTIAKSIGTCR
jgi:hypothetical protein